MKKLRNKSDKSGKNKYLNMSESKTCLIFNLFEKKHTIYKTGEVQIVSVDRKVESKGR